MLYLTSGKALLYWPACSSRPTLPSHTRDGCSTLTGRSRVRQHTFKGDTMGSFVAGVLACIAALSLGRPGRL